MRQEFGGLSMLSALMRGMSAPAAPTIEHEPRYRKSRGPQAKPRKRSNMLHISKRVRRKHRRQG